jgi:solute carrier family 39 (zinc transporter), member 1/2/3
VSLLIAVTFHQLFEGLSLGIRIASLPASSNRTTSLKAVLAVLFAITVPIGISIGLLTLRRNGVNGPQLQFVQGIMSAVSAGMLVYAACVEMLAGDFVMDPLLWRSGFRRQALAVVSLLAGAAGMSIIGM